MKATPHQIFVPIEHNGVDSTILKWKIIIPFSSPSNQDYIVHNLHYQHMILTSNTTTQTEIFNYSMNMTVFLPPCVN